MKNKILLSSILLMFLFSVSFTLALSDTGVKPAYNFDGVNASLDLSGNNVGFASISSTNTSGKILDGRNYASASAQYDALANDSTIFDYGTGNFSVDIWVYPVSYPVSSNNIIGSDMYELDFSILQAGSKPYLLVNNNCALQAGYAPTGAWTHLVVKRENGVLYIYNNGAKNATTAVCNDAIDVTDIEIGRRTQNADRYWNGKIDLLRFYNYSMSDTQVLESYNNNSGLNFPFDILETKFEVYAKNSLDNATINNFSITINSSNYTTTDGEIITNISISNATLNIFFFNAFLDNGSMFNNQTFNNINLSSNYTGYLTLWTPEPEQISIFTAIEYNSLNLIMIFLMLILLYSITFLFLFSQHSNIAMLSNSFILFIGLLLLFSDWNYFISLPNIFIPIIIFFIDNKK